MKALVLYESIYGNTKSIAEAVAQGMGDGAEVLPVQSAELPGSDVDLLVLGGPTHMHGMSTGRSRQMAVEASREDDDTQRVEELAADEPGLRTWIRDLPQGAGRQAATFDTRADKSAWLTGAASRGIAKRLRRRGYEILDSESFLVEDSEGPLVQGELERARAWGERLGAVIATGNRVEVGS